MTNQEFYSTFCSEEKCVDYIKSFYQEQLTHCPKCKHSNLTWKAKYKAWRCASCSTKTSLKSISFMRDSNKSFFEWLEIIHMLCHTKKASSIAEIHRHSKQTRYETVYHMVQKVRAEMGRINLKMTFHYQTKVRGLKAVLEQKINFLHLHIRKTANSSNDLIHLELPVTRALCIKKLDKKRRLNYPYSKLIAFSLSRNPPLVTKTLKIQGKHKRWLRVLAENMQKQLRGIFHYCSDRHIQAVLDEYTFKYNHRLSLDHTMHHFLEESGENLPT